MRCAPSNDNDTTRTKQQRIDWCHWCFVIYSSFQCWLTYAKRMHGTTGGYWLRRSGLCLYSNGAENEKGKKVIVFNHNLLSIKRALIICSAAPFNLPPAHTHTGQTRLRCRIRLNGVIIIINKLRPILHFVEKKKWKNVRIPAGGGARQHGNRSERVAQLIFIVLMAERVVSVPKLPHNNK